MPAAVVMATGGTRSDQWWGAEACTIFGGGHAMILVDPRRGSGELLVQLSRKVPAQLEQLPAGDFAFEGITESGRQLIGVERKRVNDLIDSMVKGRFSGLQLIEMANMYAELHLIVEGIWRPDRDTGVLEMFYDRSGTWGPVTKGYRIFKYRDVKKFLLTLALKTPVHVWRTSNEYETVEALASMFDWHGESWDSHTSHLQMYKKVNPGERATFRRPSLRRRIACELPHIGWERSKAVEDAFQNDEDFISFMATATVNDWCRISGIGEGIAESLVRATRGNNVGMQSE